MTQTNSEGPSSGSNAPSNIPILLLKTKSIPHDGYLEEFSSAGNGTQFKPLFVPVLEHKFLDEGLNTVRKLLSEKEIGNTVEKKYGGMIFTSQRAVEAFAKLVDEGKGMILGNLVGVELQSNTN
jgi:uroporphyrinogen-III synthase